MFTGGMAESRSRKVPISGVTNEVFSIVIE